MANNPTYPGLIVQYEPKTGIAYPDGSAWLGAFIVAAWAASILFMIGVGVYVSVIQ